MRPWDLSTQLLLLYYLGQFDLLSAYAVRRYAHDTAFQVTCLPLERFRTLRAHTKHYALLILVVMQHCS